MQDSKNTDRIITIFRALAVLAGAALIGWWIYATTVNHDSNHPFKYGLDLAGGSHLVYEADVSSLKDSEVPDLMNTLREVIERRINIFGVSEPLVQVEKSSVVSDRRAERLVVELPGVTDIDAAIKNIGQTPLLEFKLIDKDQLAAQQAIDNLQASTSGAVIKNAEVNGEKVNPYIDTGLTGRYLANAQVVFGKGSGGLSNEPVVSITFNSEGAELFEKITREHTGEQLAIFLDGELKSAPRINEAIAGGKAVISGNFTAQEARELVRNLNFGALPVPIALVSTQTIGSSLGADALRAGVHAGIIGFIALSIFLILWYRLPGVISVIALCVWVVIMLALFKLIPVVLTAAGIAGFILSVGLAVDANVLIAERMKEELRAGKNIHDAIAEGFARAWLAIRDSNIAHIIVGVILFWLGTALIKGFALVFVIGVFVSMFSAITVSRTLLLALPISADSKIGHFLMSSGFTK